MRVANGIWGGLVALSCAGTALAVTGAALADAPKAADKGPMAKIAKPEGVSLVTTVHPDKGFVEDAFAFDGSGGRLALVRADAASFAEIEVIDLAQGATSVARFDVSAFATWITRVEFVLDGSKILVWGKTADEARVTVGLFDLKGKKLRSWGPADDIALVEIKGEPVVTMYNLVTREDGLTHEIAAFRVKDGKAKGKKKTFKADAQGFVKELDMRVLYFQAGYTLVIGQKKGAYDKVKDQRLNDSEAVYDVTEGRFVRNQAIPDLVVYAKTLKTRVGNMNHKVVLALAQDGRGLEMMGVDDKRSAVETSELSFDHYLADSLVWREAPGGKIYFTLAVDPVNPEAVNKKVADPEHIDLYVLDVATGKARRLARLGRNGTPYAWAVGGGRWAVLRKHKGQDRGGPDLEIYDLTAK